MKIAAVVVLYNPEEIGIDSVVSNIISYESFVDKIYLIDNSLNEHFDLATRIKNSEFISNKNKGGIGGAQNIGCQKAFEDGFDWVMTMDQDTLFDSKQIKDYIKLIEEFFEKDSLAVSYSLRVENVTKTLHWSDFFKNVLRPIKRKVFGEKKIPHGYEYKERCISSANIVKLSVWKEIKGFNEKLFIDQVDYEFCYRLIGKGYRIVKFNDVYINQHFGEAHGFTLFRKKYAKYSLFRFYHCIRNSFVVKRNYPQYKKFYSKYITDLFFDNCVNSIHLFRNLGVFLKAKHDAKSFLL